jgi:hypothetical protein
MCQTYQMYLQSSGNLFTVYAQESSNFIVISTIKNISLPLNNQLLHYFMALLPLKGFLLNLVTLYISGWEITVEKFSERSREDRSVRTE